MATDPRLPSAHSRKHLPGHGRPQRPAPSKRHSSHAVARSSKKSVRIQEKEEVEEDIMAASFLQYCATCEKQIIVPSNAVLYCSESCRRKDNNKVLSYDSLLSDQSPPLTPLQTFAFDDFPVRDIVPQRSPTAATHAQHRLSYSSVSEDDTYSEDERRSSIKSQESEAQRYLRQLSTDQQFAEHTSRTPRPRFNRSSTALSMMSQTPSLSHSPTSTIGMSLPYTPSTTSRPLPSRTTPYSTSYKYSRSIDLVNPFSMTQIVPQTAPSSLHRPHVDRRPSLKSGATAQTSNGFAEGEMMYEKMLMNAAPSTSHGSLKQLFRYSEMPAPAPATNYARY